MVSSLQADRRQLQFDAAAGGAQAGRIEHEVGDLQHFRTDLAAFAADQRAQARFQFLDRERLGQVVVGAGAQAGEFLVERVARGQHQHRRRLARFLAQAPADLDAVQARQHQVEHDDVVGVLRREAIAVEAVGGVIHLETAALEVFAHHFRDVAVVLDDEDESARFL